MTDRETIIEILDRVGIPRRTGELDADRVERAKLPEGSTSIDVGNLLVRDPESGSVEYRDQPYDGGYGGFYSEFVFGPDGNLLAVWAWE